MLRELDRCTESGQVGSVLRREGLYSSHIVEWRRQRHVGALQAMDRKRGRKGAVPLERENERLRRRNQRLERQLDQAHKIVEVQKKVSELLGIPLHPTGDDEERGS